MTTNDITIKSGIIGKNLEMIKKLTKEQQQKATEYRDNFFQMATSTEPGNYKKAGKAALRLAEMGGLKGCEVKFVATPAEGVSLWAELSDSLWESLRDSLGASLRASLSASLGASLWDSLWDSLRESIGDSLWASPMASLWDSYYDSQWVAFYSYAVEEMGIECSDRDMELMGLYREIAANCSAVWMLPGTVIICEKPTSVTVEDGNVVDVKWGNSKE